MGPRTLWRPVGRSRAKASAAGRSRQSWLSSGRRSPPRSSASATICRLLDTAPLACGQSVETTRRSQARALGGVRLHPAYSRHYWGFKLVLSLRRRRHDRRVRPRRPQRIRARSCAALLKHNPVRLSAPKPHQRARPARRLGSGNGSNRSPTASKTELLLERHGGGTPNRPAHPRNRPRPRPLRCIHLNRGLAMSGLKSYPTRSRGEST